MHDVLAFVKPHQYLNHLSDVVGTPSWTGTRSLLELVPVRGKAVATGKVADGSLKGYSCMNTLTAFLYEPTCARSSAGCSGYPSSARSCPSSQSEVSSDSTFPPVHRTSPARFSPLGARSLHDSHCLATARLLPWPTTRTAHHLRTAPAVRCINLRVVSSGFFGGTRGRLTLNTPPSPSTRSPAETIAKT
ncbi:hypothetical protein B0H13DRAFT_2689922 [Mycena leptocephala]|nr:hypothetical protein B0H13DRAFT_2689922 [Mycena leptocephala]